MTKTKNKKGGKSPHIYCLWVSLPLLQSTLQPISTKAFARLREMKGDISLHFRKPQRAHSIIVKYSLTHTLQQGLLQQWCTSETNLFS